MVVSFSLKFQKYSNIVGSILFQFPLGINFLQGNIVPYVITYLNSVGKYKTSDVGTEVWITTSFFIGFISAVISSYLERKLGFRPTMFLGSVIVNLGVFLSYFSVQHSIWMLAVTFGLLPGIGIAQCINAAVSNIIRWMPKQMGLGVGAILTGVGSGVLPINNIIKQYVNPDNIHTNKSLGSVNVFTDKDVIGRIPYLFIVLGMISFSIQLLSMILICPVPDKKEDEMFLLKEKSGNYKTERSEIIYQCASNLTLKDLIREPSVYIIVLAGSLQIGASMVLMVTYKSFGESFLKEDLLLTNIGGFAGLLAAVCRPLFGFLADNISHKYCVMILCGVEGVLLETFYFTKYLGVVAYTAWLIIMTVIFGGILSVLRSIIPVSYGVENQATNQVVLAIGYATVSITVSPFVSLILTRLGWIYLFAVIGVFPLLSSVLMLKFNLRLPNGRIV